MARRGNSDLDVGMVDPEALLKNRTDAEKIAIREAVWWAVQAKLNGRPMERAARDAFRGVFPADVIVVLAQA
jgi:hypothetical protein